MNFSSDCLIKWSLQTSGQSYNWTAIQETWLLMPLYMYIYIYQLFFSVRGQWNRLVSVAMKSDNHVSALIINVISVSESGFQLDIEVLTNHVNIKLFLFFIFSLNHISASISRLHTLLGKQMLWAFFFKPVRKISL